MNVNAPVTLRGIKNLADQKLSICEPWSFEPQTPGHARENKEAFRQWQSRPTTNHLFFTATEPMAASQRPSKLNPAEKLHGLIADYDAKISPDMLKALLQRCPDDLQPAWVSRTFSGGARLVWLFDEPMAMNQPHLTEKFLALAKRELRLTKLLPGLDEPAWKDLHRLYDVGSEWQNCSEQRISVAVLHCWLFQAAKSVDVAKLSDVVIPLEIVEEEVHRRFPGRWEGPFEEGRRGAVFFSPGSTNPTAAIVKERGMVCFSQDKTFYSWQDIFGPAFVKKYEAEKIGRAAANVHFDGRYYYRKNAAGVWDLLSKEDFALQLRTFHGIEPARRKGETASQTDQVIAHVQRHHRVDGAAPRIYHQEDTFVENGKRYLNISRVKALPAAETPQKWGENFPWLAEFFKSCWDDPAAVQRDSLFAWFRRFYTGALRGNPPKGQALFLVGLPDRGKTLLSVIIAKAVGGSVDASSIVLGGTKFNKEAMESGLWVVDDGSAAQDEKRHKCFSELVKSVVANSSFNYEPKFKDAATVTWNGRLLVCLNDTEAGIGMIPALEPSIEDKLIILRFSEAERDFPERMQLEEMIEEELPCFLRWLTDWEVPAELQGRSRFGCKSYIHPGVRLKAMNASGLSDLVDVLKLWVERTNPGSIYGGEWIGTAADLMSLLHSDDGVRGLMRLSTVGLGRRLSQLAEVYPDFVSVSSASRHKGGGKQYRIRLTSPQIESTNTDTVPVKVDFRGEWSRAA